MQHAHRIENCLEKCGSRTSYGIACDGPRCFRWGPEIERPTAEPHCLVRAHCYLAPFEEQPSGGFVSFHEFGRYFALR
jgi:hypothetical protein